MPKNSKDALRLGKRAIRRAERLGNPSPRQAASDVVKYNQNNPALGDYVVPAAKAGTFGREGFSEKQNRKMNKVIVRKTKNVNTSNSPQGFRYRG